MGGRGSGGFRAGAGRPRKDRALKILHGTATLAERKAQAAADLEPPAGCPEPPADLTDAQRAVWIQLAPHAAAAKTLTASTAYSFRLLCQNVVMERELAADPDERARANHRGVIQRIDSQLARFALSPSGKPVAEEKDAEADPFAQFEVVQGGKS